MKRATLPLLLLLLSLDAAAGEILIPVVNRGEGAYTSVWRTDLVVSNLSDEWAAPVRATITLHRDAAEPVVLSQLLAAKETLDIPDVLHQWFDVTEGGGIVTIEWPGEGELDAWVRIYNVTGAGQFGQSVPGLPLDRLRQETHLTGLSGIDGNRTNVGIANPHAEPVMVWITLYDTAGTARGAFTHFIPARSYRQLNDIFGYFQAGPLRAATVRVSSTSQPVYAYASIVRSDTGDPTFVGPK